MGSGEWAAMILMHGFDDEAHAAQLENVMRPARAGMVNWGAAPLASVHQVLERPGVAVDDLMGAAIRLDLGDKAKFVAHARNPPMPASSQTRRAVAMERWKRRAILETAKSVAVRVVFW